MHKINGLTKEAKQTRANSVIVQKVRRRVVSTPFRASSDAAVPQPGNSNVVLFPLCDAAVRNRAGSEWALADAIVAECSEPGDDGVRNGSQAKIKAMREEIAKNNGVDLSLERIRKLRKVASDFPPGRRRSGVSLEGHLEAGTPDALDKLVKAAPAGTAFTRDYIRQQKCPTERTERSSQKEERHRQEADHQKALQGLCRQLEREKEQLEEEKQEREARYTELCRSVGKAPEPFSTPPAPEEKPTLTSADDLERALRRLLVSRGFDPAALKQAIADFVAAVLAQQQ